MKYKIGDKVKIRTWDSMEKEFGIDSIERIKCHRFFVPNMDKDIIELYTNRVVTINKIDGRYDYYIAKEIGYSLSDDMIEYSLQELEEKTRIPVGSRWELLDL